MAHPKCETEHELRAIDLFSGCGGLTLGLKRAGFRVVAAVELDLATASTYTANHPEVKMWRKDIRALTPSAIRRRLKLRKGQLDLLAGCPPCQGFSPLRTLNGSKSIDDPRNDLVSEFIRFVELLAPKAVMFENVPDLADDKRFSAFTRTLKKLGYCGSFGIVNAADYGVPQRRERLIYVAGRGFRIRLGRRPGKRKTVRQTIANFPVPGSSGDPIHDIPERRSQRILELIRRIPRNGGSRTDLPEEQQLACHRKCSGFKDVYGRMGWDDVAPTLTGGCFNPSKGRFLHPEQDRAITIREASALQGFPRSYKFRGTRNKSNLAAMVGNALPPALAKWYGTRVKMALATGHSAIVEGTGSARSHD